MNQLHPDSPMLYRVLDCNCRRTQTQPLHRKQRRECLARARVLMQGLHASTTLGKTRGVRGLHDDPVHKQDVLRLSFGNWDV